MYYTVYKTTNTINGKYYIGKHQTTDLNDGYMGSGKLLKRAIAKHGIEHFSKEILYVFNTEEEMNRKEKELVVVSEETYNLCEGGKGGFGYINRNGLKSKNYDDIFAKARQTLFVKYGVHHTSQLPSTRIRNKNRMIILNRSGKVPYGKSFRGKTHSEETKTKISIANSKMIGSKNSQFGTCWITNGIENKKIKKELLDEWVTKGYRQGRI